MESGHSTIAEWNRADWLSLNRGAAARYLRRTEKSQDLLASFSQISKKFQTKPVKLIRSEQWSTPRISLTNVEC